MTSVKGKMVRWFGGLVLHTARVQQILDAGPSFRLLGLSGDTLGWQPGDKIQVLLPSDDMRTYTPVPNSDGSVTLCGWRHAGGPGARWITEIAVGDPVRFVGPDRSLRLPAGPVVIVGDETSIAVAASFALDAGRSVGTVLQAGAPDEVHRAAEALGIRKATVLPRGDGAALLDAIVAAHAERPGSTIGITGGAKLVADVRAALRARGVTQVKMKTYWIPGRVGLD